MLTETGGDLEKAIDAFRKKGVKTSIAERAANEGRVFAATTADKSTSVAIEINCNTDFTAKSEVLEKALEKAAHKLLHDPSLILTDDVELKSELTGTVPADRRERCPRPHGRRHRHDRQLPLFHVRQRQNRGADFNQRPAFG